MPRSAQSSLSHCTTTRPGMVAGSSGTTESSCPWQITMPPECWPRCRGRSCTALYSSRNLRMRGFVQIEPGIAELPLAAYRRDPSIPTPRTRLDSRSSVSTSKPSALPTSRAADRPAIRDHVGRHRRAQLAVALVDILNGALALIAAGQIQIDIRPLAALFRKKPLEQQIHLHRIHRRDPQRITHRAIGRRAAPLHQNSLFAGRIHDVPHDQEIAGQLQLLDQRQLALDLLAAPSRDTAGSAAARLHPCACAETNPWFRPSGTG